MAGKPVQLSRPRCYFTRFGFFSFLFLGFFFWRRGLCPKYFWALVFRALGFQPLRYRYWGERECKSWPTYSLVGWGSPFGESSPGPGCSGECLEVHWVDISGDISPLIWVIIIVTLLITPLITAHESKWRGGNSWGDGWFLFDFGLVMIAILEQVLSVAVAGSAGQQHGDRSKCLLVSSQILTFSQTPNLKPKREPVAFL